MTGRTRAPAIRAAAAIVAAACLGPAPLGAQTLDITRPPRLGPPRPLEIPIPARTRLPNGLRLYVIELHEVPLVQFTLTVAGGGREDGNLPGLASFTADMLDEGADTLDAFGIAAQAAYLGATLATGADWDRMIVSLEVPRRSMAPALDLMAAVALRPTFRSADVARERGIRLARILQRRDDPQVLARLAFYAVVFPPGHPYHNPLTGDSASTVRLDSAVVREFWRRTARPERATMIVAGDITRAEAERLVRRTFGGAWTAERAVSEPAGPSRASPPVPATPPAPPPRGGGIYLVDKPRAPQSVIVIGQPGVDRKSPDFYALQVMNTILGGSFSSRLNQNLRETRGYTYGAGSGFEYRPLPGPFFAAAAVRADVTDSALVEFLKELNGIRDGFVSDSELARAKAYLTLSLPAEFETAGQLAGQVAGLLLFGLPLDYYRSYVPRIMAVTAADVRRVARRYLHPDRMAVVVAGDAAALPPKLEALGLGPVRPLEVR